MTKQKRNSHRHASWRRHLMLSALLVSVGSGTGNVFASGSAPSPVGGVTLVGMVGNPPSAEMGEQPSPKEPTASVQPRHHDGTPYTLGGISKEEAQHIAQRPTVATIAKQYPGSPPSSESPFAEYPRTDVFFDDREPDELRRSTSLPTSSKSTQPPTIQTAAEWVQTYRSILKFNKKKRWLIFDENNGDFTARTKKQTLTTANREEVERCIKAFNSLPAAERRRAYKQMSKRGRAKAKLRNVLNFL